MSTSSPQSPQSQGALEEASSPKSRVRITVLTILALHVVVIGGLLLQGCDKRSGSSSTPTNTLGALPSLAEGTNAYYSAFPGDGGSNAASTAAAPIGSSPAASAGITTGTGIPGPGGSPDATAATGAGSPASSTAVPPAFPGSLASGGATAPAGATGGGLAPLAAGQGTPGAGASAAGLGAAQTEHVIKKGDTIGALARKYKVTEKAITDANPQVKARSLRIDDKLVIPPPAPASPEASQGGATAAGGMGTSNAAGEVYVVKPGDTLARIAKKFGVSVKALRGANNLKSDRIVPKQRLTIPIKAVPTTTAPQP